MEEEELFHARQWTVAHTTKVRGLISVIIFVACDQTLKSMGANSLPHLFLAGGTFESQTTEI